MPIIFNKWILNLLLLSLYGCGQSYNSNSNDKGQFTNVEIDTTSVEGVRFSAAYNVLQAKCMACHDWAGFNTSEKWIESGYVNKGDYLGSPIIMSLKNYGGNMPKDPYPELSATETAALDSWISNL